LSENPETLYAQHMLGAIGNWVNDDKEIIHAVKQARIVNRCDLTGRCS